MDGGIENSESEIQEWVDEWGKSPTDPWSEPVEWVRQDRFDAFLDDWSLRTFPEIEAINPFFLQQLSKFLNERGITGKALKAIIYGD